MTTIADVDLSILLPAYNEADNLPSVLKELVGELAETGTTWEILVVDDGSVDGTTDVLTAVESDEPRIRHISLRRNFGKSEALRVGFGEVRGSNVALMDADGQDNPAELARLLAELDAGADLVTGRRSIRNDRFVKRQTSRLYNWTTAKVTGVPGRDFNSGFKVMRREVAGSLEMYGELHRYIPVLAAWMGFRVVEADVNHRPRLEGRSKFGRSRFWRGFLDLVTVKFITTYDARPFHFIGGLGILSAAVGAVLLAWMLVLRIQGEAIGQRPALLAGVLFGLVGIQLVSVGLLAELFVSLGRRRPHVTVRDEGGGH